MASGGGADSEDVFLVDEECELFAEDLFRCLWYIFEITDTVEPRTDSSYVTNDESFLSGNILKAVLVYMQEYRVRNLISFTRRYQGWNDRSDIFGFITGNALAIKRYMKRSVVHDFLLLCSTMTELVLYLNARGHPLTEPCRKEMAPSFGTIFMNYYEKDFYDADGWTNLEAVAEQIGYKYQFLEPFMDEARVRYSSFLSYPEIAEIISQQNPTSEQELQHQSEEENEIPLFESHPRLGVPTPEAMMSNCCPDVRAQCSATDVVLKADSCSEISGARRRLQERRQLNAERKLKKMQKLSKTGAGKQETLPMAASERLPLPTPERLPLPASEPAAERPPAPKRKTMSKIRVDRRIRQCLHAIQIQRALLERAGVVSSAKTESGQSPACVAEIARADSTTSPSIGKTTGEVSGAKERVVSSEIQGKIAMETIVTNLETMRIDSPKKSKGKGKNKGRKR